MRVFFDRWEEAFTTFRAAVRRLAAEEDVRQVCDIGGGANPILAPEGVRERGLRCTLLDVSEEQLGKAPDGYDKVRADVASPGLPHLGPYDLAFSQMLAEHVRDARTFHHNVHALLRPGGRALHLFPTLYELPFLVNRLLPNQVSEPVLRWIQPYRTREGKEPKFPVYYRWCRGPTARQQRTFESIGFRVEEYAGFFGHNYYEKVPPLDVAEKALARALLRRPVPWFTSYAWVLLRRA